MSTRIALKFETPKRSSMSLANSSSRSHRPSTPIDHPRGIKRLALIEEGHDDTTVFKQINGLKT